MGRPAAAITLTPTVEGELQSFSRSRSLPSALVQRACLVSLVYAKQIGLLPFFWSKVSASLLVFVSHRLRRQGMKKRFTEEQKAFALRQAESGVPVQEILRKMGISEATFYRWKQKYGGMGVAEIRRLKQLEDENRRLKGLVADLTLDKQILQDVLSKKL